MNGNDQTDRIDRIKRRAILKTGAILAGGAVVTGSAGAAPEQGSRDTSIRGEETPAGAISTAQADPKPPSHGDPIWGEETTVGAGRIRTYATTNPAGKLSSLGVHVDCDAMAAFGDEAVDAHLHFPDETEDGEGVDTNQFTFAGLHYNPAGHPPPGVYDVPHVDFHFYMQAEEAVEAISGGPLAETPMPFLGLTDYEIPDEQFPPGYTFEKHRFIVEEMGEHLLDGTAPELQGEEFTHTYLYGAYDPSVDLTSPDGSKEIELGGDSVEMPVYAGDGEGRVTFVEPMVTTDFLRNDLSEAVAVEVATPDAFFEADEYPTAYVMKPDGDGGAYVSVDGFEAFPGPSGC
jgi:hypothetical protein